MAQLQVLSLAEGRYFNKDFLLRQKSREIKKEEMQETWFKNLIYDMFETLYSDSSGVGLAAPQIGMLIKLVVIDIKRDGKKPLVLVNPKYQPIGNDKLLSTESCLSVPNHNGKILRYSKVKVNALNHKGEPIEIIGEKFLSNVLQHEIDHLDGILYIDKISNDEVLQDNDGYPAAMAGRAMNNFIF